MNSKEKLAEALAAAGAPEPMIENARAGYYSDFDSPLEAPCVQLVMDLHNLGLRELQERAMNGEFDATAEESDAWWEREGKQIAHEAKLPAELFERKQPQNPA